MFYAFFLHFSPFSLLTFALFFSDLIPHDFPLFFKSREGKGEVKVCLHTLSCWLSTALINRSIKRELDEFRLNVLCVNSLISLAKSCSNSVILVRIFCPPSDAWKIFENREKWKKPVFSYSINIYYRFIEIGSGYGIEQFLFLLLPRVHHTIPETVVRRFGVLKLNFNNFNFDKNWVNVGDNGAIFESRNLI